MERDHLERKWVLQIILVICQRLLAVESWNLG